MHANVLILRIYLLQSVGHKPWILSIEIDLVIRSISTEYASLVVWAICTLDQVHTWYQFHALVNFHGFPDQGDGATLVLGMFYKSNLSLQSFTLCVKTQLPSPP